MDFAGLAPEVEFAFLRVAVDLFEFRFGELELLDRVERIVELLNVACADERRGDALSRSTQAMAICASVWPRP